MTKVCDNTSVGTIIRDSEDRFAFLIRKKFPYGVAPSAGHIDDHGSAEQAAVNEVREELGLITSLDNLKETTINERLVTNHCSRLNGDHHIWTVFEANAYEGKLTPDADETKGASWYTLTEIQALAERTKAYRAGNIPEADWLTTPGLEPIWLDFLSELGYV